MATTPVDPRVFEQMQPYLTQMTLCGNPVSMHTFGIAAKKAVSKARNQVAKLLNTTSDTIVFTSGATEALNLALKGAAQFHQHKGRHIITTQVEHKAVLDTCEYLQQHEFEVTYLKPASDGTIAPEQIQHALRDDTILVAVMAVNNEIGTINDIQQIGEITRPRGIIFAVDAAQAVGKIPLNCAELKIDLMAISSHKMYGPKGIGALYVSRNPRVRITPQMHGGGHEGGLRSGILATHQIVGFGAACEIALHDMKSDTKHITQLQQCFLDIIADIPDIKINGSMECRLANNLNICVKGIDAEALLTGLPHIALSTASACNSIVNQASYVLKAIGLSDYDAFSSLRISFGRFTTIQEVEMAARALSHEIQRLRAFAPSGG